MSDTKPIPDGFHSITPALVVGDAAKAIDFYKAAFGAEEVNRMTSPDGSKVMHSELRIGDSLIFICDEFPDYNLKSPATLGGNSSSFHLYVEDVDAVFAKALEAGATATMPVEDAFWGDRYGKVSDPFGHQWGIATHTKDMTTEEMERASKEYFAQAESA
jgi:uncharacterized glyoxalase superfamily protein PhnB